MKVQILFKPKILSIVFCQRKNSFTKSKQLDQLSCHCVFIYSNIH